MPAEDRRTKALFQKLSRLMAKLSSGAAPEVVHHLRTTIRRVETLLKHRVAEEGKTATVLGQLKRIRRRAGVVRDLHVQMVAIKTLNNGSVAREKAAVLRALTKAEKQRSRKLLKVLKAELNDGLQRRLRSAQEMLAPQALAADPATYAETALTRFATVAQAHGRFTETNLHPFRMDCKRIRYLAEMAVGDPRGESIVRQLKRVQDAIGEWHDWFNLERTAVDALGRPGSPLVARIRAQKQRKFSDALRVVAKVEHALLSQPDQPGKKRCTSVPHRPAVHTAAAG